MDNIGQVIINKDLLKSNHSVLREFFEDFEVIEQEEKANNIYSFVGRHSEFEKSKSTQKYNFFITPNSYRIVKVNETRN